jgi:DNA-directed RNA polymerase subunit RPC12/RpoP
MSGEPANFSLEDATRWRARRRPSWATPPGPIPTLGALQKSSAWWWVYCDRCQRRVATALAPYVIRWGDDTSSDKLRRSARCVKCGHKGAMLQHPGWTGSQTGFESFPVEIKEAAN